MAEDTPYFNSIIAQRSMLLSDEEALEGNTLVSIETSEEHQETDAYVFIQENFSTFIRYLRKLTPRQQELLLAYFVVGKTQTQLADTTSITQTVCSSLIREAVATMGAMIMFGDHPSVEQMRPVLIRAGIESVVVRQDNRSTENVTVAMSALVGEFSKCHSYKLVAEKYGIWRPDVRRFMSQAQKKLRLSLEPSEQAIGHYILSLTDKSSALGQGISEREKKKYQHYEHRDPAILGEFRVDVSDPDFHAIFAPRAQR